MRLYATLGQRSSAIRQLALCTEMFERELAITPDQATVALSQALLPDRSSASMSRSGLPARKCYAPWAAMTRPKCPRRHAVQREQSRSMTVF